MKKEIRVTERVVEVVNLRLGGEKFSAIAERFGVTESTVRTDFEKALGLKKRIENLEKEAVSASRILEMIRSEFGGKYGVGKPYHKAVPIFEERLRQIGDEIESLSPLLELNIIGCGNCSACESGYGCYSPVRPS